jgi:magnesium transporter
MAEIENPPHTDTDDIESRLHEVEDLLDRVKAAEAATHRQDAVLDDESEASESWSVVMAELRLKLEPLDATYLSYILEAMADEDRQLLWRLIDEARRPEILQAVSGETRTSLIGPQSYRDLRKMPNAFELQGGRLHPIAIETGADLARAQPIWIDVVSPSDEDRAMIGEIFGIDLPVPEEHTDLEASARFYVDENGAIHLHSDFLLDKEDESRNVPVTFILHRNILFSVRKEELPVFRLQRLRARTQVGAVSDCLDVLLDLYAADVEYSADALEDVYAALEAVGKRVLSTEMTDAQAAKVLAAIALEEDLNGRIRRNVLDTRRAVSFLMRGRFLSSNQIADSQQLLRDIESLDGHTSFLFDKINFLMDATVGFININQNKVVKIFSVASVALLPPTLIASIYGMNFKFMPELEWQLGYPFSLTLMLVSVGLPFYLFYRKGWLK